MKKEIEILIEELKEAVQREFNFRKETEPKPNPYDAMRSIDREYIRKEVIKRLEDILKIN